MRAPVADPSASAAVEHTGARHGSSRRTPRWLLVAAGVLLIARVAGAVYEAQHFEATAELVRWRPITAAQATALATGKPILYDFTAEWCVPCRVMGREVFADASAARQIETLFVPVRVLDRMREEGRNPPEVTLLQQRYRVTAFPTLVAVAPDGRELARVEGYPGKQSVLRQLARARNAEPKSSPPGR